MSAEARAENEWWSSAAPAPDPCGFGDRARARQSILTKPPGSLGALEDIAITLAGLQQTDRPTAENCTILVFAGDHGVTANGVSPYPQDITAQMVANFANGGAAISVMARALSADLRVVDVGVAGDIALGPQQFESVTVDKCKSGTDDFTKGAAMSPDVCRFAIDAGRRAVCDAGKTYQPNILVLGEMGIGNTTSAAALTSALLMVRPDEAVGPGTGLDAAGIARKADIIGGALTLHGLSNDPAQSPDTAFNALAKVGGLEIAALVGALIAAGQARLPVIVDGFIVTAAAAVATALNPTVRPWLLFAHQSAEPGHRLLLSHLDASPLLSLGMRLGEGTGAAAALPLIRLACALHRDMATFAEAGLSEGATP
ncbi:MAG: nicotinate-nucleotide--dimethylbenzimidazole phosphoribosyltransferase [Pseudomonadota bacterium]